MPSVAEHYRDVLADLQAALEPGGRFIATFRDLSSAVEDLDRFVPVRSDDTTILTCLVTVIAARS